MFEALRTWGNTGKDVSAMFENITVVKAQNCNAIIIETLHKLNAYQTEVISKWVREKLGIEHVLIVDKGTEITFVESPGMKPVAGSNF